MVDTPGDEIRIAAADVEVPGQVWGAVGGPRVRVRWGWPVHLGSHNVWSWIVLGLELHVCQLRHTDSTHHRPPLSRVGIRRLTVETVVQIKWVVGRLGGGKVCVLPDLRLAVDQGVGPAVCVGTADVEVPQRVAVSVCMHQASVELLHHSLVVGGWAVRRGDQGTVPMGWDVVGPHDVTASNTRVGGHRGGLQVGLRGI